MYFRNKRRISVAVTSSNTKSNMRKAPSPIGKAKANETRKSEACQAEIEMLLEYDMIEPSKSPWACGVVMAKKKGGSIGFAATFAT